jgi:hypothetical protein
MKRRCLNCDCVADMQKHPDAVFQYNLACARQLPAYLCYQCNSIRTVETDEPYRLPKWERQPAQADDTRRS